MNPEPDDVLRLAPDPKTGAKLPWDRGKRERVIREQLQGQRVRQLDVRLKTERIHLSANTMRGAALWHTTKALEYPEPVDGCYPQGFLDFALRALGAVGRPVLHVCSGGLPPMANAVRVDLRASQKPDVCADGRALPFRDGCFAAVLIDPPYCVEYAESLYGTGYPRPSHLLAEACRVVRPCGMIGFLHYLVPKQPPGARFVRAYGLMTGLGYRIRAFSIYEREQARLT